MENIHKLDIVTEHGIYQVFAYDYRTGLAVVRDIECLRKPFKVFEGLDTLWNFEGVRAFKSLDMAYEWFDKKGGSK
jgi:hypothetical protein